MEEICLELAQCKSYRVASEIANRLLRRCGADEIKPTTLEYRTVSEGMDIAEAYKEKASEILTSYGIDPKMGCIKNSTDIPKSILNPDIPLSHTWDSCIEVIDNYNSGRTCAESIMKHELADKIEVTCEDCCYVSIDDIGVKHQKEERNPNAVKGGKYVENTVIHIQSGNQQYTLTAIGMRNAFILLVAFLLNNGLLEGKRLVFLSDGATIIKDYIQEYFGFRKYTLILDWLHLKKKCKEFMSMAITAKNKDKKQEIVRNFLRILWAGNTDEAIEYLDNLKPANIKNQKILSDMVAYLQRKQPYIQCYALRYILGLRNSSNTVEKANDLVVAQRQKHNGMSWSKDGSGALAIIAATKRNNELDDWIHQHVVRFSFAA